MYSTTTMSMLIPGSTLLLLLLLVAAHLAAAQAPTVGNYPICAQNCLSDVLDNSIGRFCTATLNGRVSGVCLCNNSAFYASISSCAGAACSAADAQTTRVDLVLFCAANNITLAAGSSLTLSSTSSSPSSTGSSSTGTTSSSSSTTTPGSSTSELSTGAKAGIGVGAAVGVILVIVVVVVLLFRRRKRTRRQTQLAEPYSHGGGDDDKEVWHSHGRPDKPELAADVPVEAAAPAPPAELADAGTAQRHELSSMPSPHQAPIATAAGTTTELQQESTKGETVPPAAVNDGDDDDDDDELQRMKADIEAVRAEKERLRELHALEERERELSRAIVARELGRGGA